MGLFRRAGASELRLCRRLGLHRHDGDGGRRACGRCPDRIPLPPARHLLAAGRAHRQMARRRRHVGVRRHPATPRDDSGGALRRREVGAIETVSIRSGVTCGDVILMEGDDYIGHCVNVAARLCDLASSGEALAAPAVMDFLPSWGQIVSETHVNLRGVEKPVPASSICMAGLAAPTGPRTPSVASPDRGHGPGDRPRCARPHGVVLLARLRRYLAPPSGALALPLSAISDRSGHPV